MVYQVTSSMPMSDIVSVMILWQILAAEYKIANLCVENLIPKLITKSKLINKF